MKNVIENKPGLIGDLQQKMHESNSNDFTHQLIIDKTLAMGLGVGTSSVIARAIGEGDRDRPTEKLTAKIISVIN